MFVTPADDRLMSVGRCAVAGCAAGGNDAESHTSGQNEDAADQRPGCDPAQGRQRRGEADAHRDRPGPVWTS